MADWLASTNQLGLESSKGQLAGSCCLRLRGHVERSKGPLAINVHGPGPKTISVCINRPNATHTQLLALHLLHPPSDAQHH